MLTRPTQNALNEKNNRLQAYQYLNSHGLFDYEMIAAIERHDYASEMYKNLSTLASKDIVITQNHLNLMLRHEDYAAFSKCFDEAIEAYIDNKEEGRRGCDWFLQVERDIAVDYLIESDLDMEENIDKVCASDYEPSKLNYFWLILKQNKLYERNFRSTYVCRDLLTLPSISLAIRSLDATQLNQEMLNELFRLMVMAIQSPDKISIDKITQSIYNCAAKNVRNDSTSAIFEGLEVDSRKRKFETVTAPTISEVRLQPACLTWDLPIKNKKDKPDFAPTRLMR